MAYYDPPQIGDLLEELDIDSTQLGKPAFALVLSEPDCRGNQVRQDLYILNKGVFKSTTIAMVYYGQTFPAFWKKIND